MSKKPEKPLTSFNVICGDVIQLPQNFADFEQVKISWYQDHETFKSSVVSRSATYCVGYGYTGFDPAHEVLVFIATELLADNYSFAPGHLSKNKNWKRVPDTVDDSTQKISSRGCIEFEVDRNWQYGSVSGYDRFIVYHPKSRKPFSKRFTNAIAVTPGVLNALLADTKTGLKLSGAAETGAGLGAMLAIGAVQGVVGKMAELADGKMGERLQDFAGEKIKRLRPITPSTLPTEFRPLVELSPDDPYKDNSKKPEENEI